MDELSQKSMDFTLRTRSAVLIWAALLLAAPDLQAQQSQNSSYWYAVSVGGAGVRLTCDLCQPAREVGPILAFSAGGYANDNLRVGFEYNHWTYRQETAREKTYTFGIVAHLVPNANRGFYLLGGAGWIGYRAGDFTYDAPKVTVGLGWDIPAFGDWMVGNIVSLDAASFASIRGSEVPVVRGAGISSLRAAVQIRKR